MTTRPEPCRIALIGMMGSGKSTVGRILAQRTGWPYHDNDALLRRRSGRTARQLLAERGEPAMRASEADALAFALEQPEPCIVGAAGGSILNPASRALLSAAAHVVYLRARPATLSARAGGAAHRPWLEGDGEAWLRARLGERSALYEAVAGLVVDTDQRRPRDVADDILAWLKSSLACAAG